jgi:alanyl-tRNA synthetase
VTLPYRSSQQIRETYLRHFADRGHTVVPSANLIADDPTLLLVNAGMVPFKPYLLGETPPPYPRAASVQKVVRTNDIDGVGRTSRHLSFFEMCGNFSFGDYFKQGAIPLAWELLIDGFGFPPERMWATVYLDDDEAFELWRRFLPAERIQRRGKEDNYWSMGVPGPCGPCSEIYYDRGPGYGREGGPVVDEERHLEVWNLVFMQYERGPGAGYDYPILRELPNRNIDTGLGLERLATLLQGVDSVFDIDGLRPVLDRACELTGTRYGAAPDTDVAVRVVAEHSRTCVMLLADGVVPANEGRGYVLRRMLRRVVQKARLLGAHDPVLPELVAAVRAATAAGYPELDTDAARIEALAAAEEASFLHTLRAGSTVFDSYAAQTREQGGRRLTGERAFTLHDTYGFPIDLTLELAADAGLEVDEDGFRRLMAEQRARAKADSAAKKTGHVDVSAYRALQETAGPSTFTGYEQVRGTAAVRGLLNPAGGLLPVVGEGAEVEVALDRTPFYAEAGGQLADQGRLVADGAELDVLDVQSPVPGLIVHRARVLRGELRAGAEVQALVDVGRRQAISRAHTATHLVHTGMRRALGDTATQAGSENAPGRFRFDFHNPQAVPPSVLKDVEAEVNEVLLGDLEVRAFVTSQEEARRIGAMMLFGEKYGEQVRVVEVGHYARELCGGTHVARSGQLGAVKLLGEASIGAGVRRVEALVGIDAFRFLAREHTLVTELAALLKVRPDELPERVAERLDRLRAAEKELERFRAEALLRDAGSLLGQARDVGGVAVLAVEAPAGTTAEQARRLVLDLRGRLDGDRAAVVAVAAGSSVVIATTGSARGRGLSAGDLVREVTAAVGGRGGGKPDLAQGGLGSDPDGASRGLAFVEAAVRRATAP